jgi:glycolate oxidase iron-sulfur subunit
VHATLLESLRDSAGAREAQDVLRKCVHCGFCLATCPTYQVLGDELDSPRGRIYLVKQVLEGDVPTATTQRHLDRCLTCRSCETTCPSGVEYHRLLDTGRALVDAQVRRPWRERLRRFALRAVLPRRWLFGLLVRAGRLLAWALPPRLHRQLYTLPAGDRPRAGHARRVLLLQGCVQPALRPRINAAAARVLDRLGISAVEVPQAGCCGALRHHLSDTDGARADLRRLIDAWWPDIEAGADAIVSSASGCGVQLQDAGRLLRDDPAYAEKAARVAALTRDLSAVIAAEPPLRAHALPGGTVAFQSPCTLQHGHGSRGVVEGLLQAAGYHVTATPDAHLCCGSAGTYSILQPQLAAELRARKLEALAAGQPVLIASANIGCITHLAAGTETPVRHWIELLDERLGG